MARIITTGEAARSIGTSQATVRRLISEGTLPATLVGDRFAINASDLDAYIASSEEEDDLDDDGADDEEEDGEDDEDEDDLDDDDDE